MVSMIALSVIQLVATVMGLHQRTAQPVLLLISCLKQSKLASSLLLAPLATGLTLMATAGLVILSVRFAMDLVSMNAPHVARDTSKLTKDKDV